MEEPEKMGGPHVPWFRAGILLLAVAAAVLVIGGPHWLEGYFKTFLSKVPFPRVVIPVVFIFGYPLLLTMIHVGTGAVPWSWHAFCVWYVTVLIDLYADLALLLMVLVPVGLMAFLYLTVAFFLAMTIAGFVWGYRWVTGKYEIVMNTDLAIILLIYFGLLAFLLVAGWYAEKLEKKKRRYVGFAHETRGNIQKWVVSVRGRLLT
jgi:hypothetical protein